MSKLTDDEVYDLLHKARLVLGKKQASTQTGQMALDAAHKVMTAFQLVLVANTEGIDLSRKDKG